MLYRACGPHATENAVGHQRGDPALRHAGAKDIAENPGILTFYVAMLTRWCRAFPVFPDLAVSLAAFPALHARVAAGEATPDVQRIAARHGLTGRFLTEPEG